MVLDTVEATISVEKMVTPLTMVETLTTVVVVLKVPVTAAFVVVTVVVTGTVEVTVDGGPVTVFTGVEVDRMRIISGSNVVVDFVVLIAVLAEVVASFVTHLTELKVEEPTVFVKSALTWSNMARKKNMWKIMMECKSKRLTKDVVDLGMWRGNRSLLVLPSGCID